MCSQLLRGRGGTGYESKRRAEIHENDSGRADSPRNSVSDNFSQPALKLHHPFPPIGPCCLSPRRARIYSYTSLTSSAGSPCGHPHLPTRDIPCPHPRNLSHQVAIRHLRGYMGVCGKKLCSSSSYLFFFSSSSKSSSRRVFVRFLHSDFWIL